MKDSMTPPSTGTYAMTDNGDGTYTFKVTVGTPDISYTYQAQFGGNDQYHSTTSDTIDIQPYQ
jgi:hypothetical protein